MNGSGSVHSQAETLMINRRETEMSQQFATTSRISRSPIQNRMT